jgi:large subunit ribosomal protein L7/L12
MVLNREQRIASMEQRLRQLKCQQQRVEARRRHLAGRLARREDTRRKILVGAVVLSKVEQGVLEDSVLRGWLDGALTREDDRRLFDL